MKNLAQQETWFPLMFRPIRSIWGREVMAELLGNFVFVTIGLLGSVWSSTNCGGNHLVLQPIIWGMAMTCGMFVCGGYSGGQLNPAVNVGFWVLNRNRRRVKLLNKMFAQCAGAFLASAFVIVFSYQWLFAKYGTNWLKNNEVISIFAPKLSSSMDDWGIVALEMFVAAFMFTLLLAAVTDLHNLGTDQFLFPVYIGAALASTGFAFGVYSGLFVSPVLDIMPRLAASLAGLQHVWTWWVLAAIAVRFWGGVAGIIFYEEVISPRDYYRVKQD